MTSRRQDWRLRRRRIAALILAGLLVGGGAVVALGGEEGLVFSHRVHVLENDMECEACHENASGSSSGKDDLLTRKEVCAGCHDVEARDECGVCHRETPPGGPLERIVDYSPLFSHEDHVEADLDCDRCHLGVAEKDAVAGRHLPGMADCMTCHRARKASVECLVCHLPGEELRPADHLAGWTHAHQDLAGQGPDRCWDCHTVDGCQECHQGDNLFQRTHPANYEFDHALEAQGRDHECAACHENSEFCVACHRERGLVPHPVSGVWANAFGGSHADEAKSDIGSCMLCHDEGAADPVCARCH